jgi:hypothetical protein
MNSFTEPASRDSDAMWLSSGKPRKLSSSLEPPAAKLLQRSILEPTQYGTLSAGGSSCCHGPKSVYQQIYKLESRTAVSLVTTQAKDARQNHYDAASITSTGGLRL